MHERIVPVLRYVGSLAGSLVIIGGSLVLLLEAPGSSATAKPEPATAAALKRSVEIKPLPVVKAADLDISRVVRVEVKGKTEPQTIAAPTAVAANAAAPMREVTVHGTGATATVVADAVNLRAGPRKTSARLGTVRSGTTVTILTSERGWTEIATADGTTGWLASKFLSQ